jgi:uncharacterized damage-inducible protein DinB
MTPEQAIFLFHNALPSFENEHRLTTKVLKAIPADKAGYRPDPVAMSAFELAWHIASSETRFSRTILKGVFDSSPMTPATTMAEVVEFYVENFKQNLSELKQLSGEQLATMIDFRGMFQMPAVEYIHFSTRHSIHHRGQLSVYLRPMGAKVPSMYGESYDDKQARLSTAAG